MERLWKVGEVAARLNVTRQAVWRMVREDRIPHVRLSERNVRFVPEEIERWLAERTRP